MATFQCGRDTPSSILHLKSKPSSGPKKPSSGLSKQSANPNIEASQRGAPFPIIPENLNLMLLELALLNKQIDL